MLRMKELPALPPTESQREFIKLVILDIKITATPLSLPLPTLWCSNQSVKCAKAGKQHVSA